MVGKLRYIGIGRLNSLFLRFLATYVVLLLIPLILAFVVNGAVLRRFQETVEESRLGLLRQTRDVISQSIDDLEWRVFQIAGNPRLSRLMTEYGSTGDEDYGLIRELVTYLHGYTLYSSNLKSTFYVYLREPPIILTPYAMYRHADFSDDRTYLQIEGTTLADWHAGLLSRYYRRGFFPARRVTIEDFTNKPMVPYVQSIPAGTPVDPAVIDGVIVFFIGEEEFSSLLRNVTLPSGGWAYITGREGQVITGVRNEGNERLAADLPEVIRPVAIDPAVPEGLHRATVDGQDVFVVHTRSAAGWTYVAVLPSRPILAPVYRLQRISVVSLALSMLIAMAIASVVSYRRAQPLQRLFASLRDFSGLDLQENASISALNSGVRRLIDQSRHLQDELRRQEIFHQHLLVSRLLEGSFRSSNEIQSFMSYLDITISESCYVVVVMSLAGFESLDSVDMIEQLNHSKVVLKDLVNQHVRERTFIHDGNDESITLIVMTDRPDSAIFINDVTRELAETRRSFELVYHDRLLIGIGTARTEIMGIAPSFEEARRALARNKRAGGGEITVFSADMVDTRGYYFPLDLEVRITNATRAGDVDALDAAFHALYEENFRKREVLGSQLRFLYHELFGTYQKLVHALTAEGVEPPEDPSASPIVAGEGSFDTPDIIGNLEEQFREIARTMQSRKRSHNRTLMNRIVEYIDTHYSDNGLGLYVVASTFSITESYLSFFFKEQMGENFSSYVENVRIGRSCDLLRTTEMSIAEVAAAVGYNSDKTFRRVFKKAKGISPTDFRRELTLRQLL